MIWTLAILPVTLLALGTPIFALFLAGAALTFAFFLTCLLYTSPSPRDS